MNDKTVIIPKLKMFTKTTHYVDWYDLSEFLSYHLFGASNYSFDLLEAKNDTDYSIDVQLSEHDLNSFWVQAREEFIIYLQAGYCREVRENVNIPDNESWRRKSYVGVEDYDLRTLMLAAHERGWIEAGNYVVRLSY